MTVSISITYFFQDVVIFSGHVHFRVFVLLSLRSCSWDLQLDGRVSCSIFFEEVFQTHIQTESYYFLMKMQKRGRSPFSGPVTNVTQNFFVFFETSGIDFSSKLEHIVTKTRARSCLSFDIGEKKLRTLSRYWGKSIDRIFSKKNRVRSHIYFVLSLFCL